MELVLVLGVLSAWLTAAMVVGLLIGNMIRLRDRVAPVSVPQRRDVRLRRVV
ncbi:MAG TPA: hypothetical protein VER39_14940 [Nocardioidaceae bacterium]|nr:hypothetical protein [Nocardioidaceae bacterium]